MSCETVIGSIVALLDDELSADERQAVEAHVAACASCRTEMAQLRTTRRLVASHLRAAGERVTPPAFDQVWSRLAAETSGGARATRRSAAGRAGSVVRPAGNRRRWAWAGAGAGVALAASLALLVLAPRMTDVQPRQQPEAPRAAVAPPAAAPVVAAKPQPRPATRVAKQDPPADAPAKQQVARRSEPRPAEQPDAREGEPEQAVAVNELDPPRELLERPDLFLNYPLVRKLDELRHLEAVLADQDDDGGAG